MLGGRMPKPGNHDRSLTIVAPGNVILGAYCAIIFQQLPLVAYAESA
jgi:hypothetical protein